MLELAQKGFTARQVLDRLTYASGSREVEYRYDLLNNDDKKIGELSTISGSISFSSAAQIKRTGQFSMYEYEYRDIDFLNDRIQPFYRLNMDGVWLEWPLGIFLISSPTRRAKGKTVTRVINAYDANLILTQSLFTNRYLIKQGTTYVNAVKQIIQDTGIDKVDIRACDSVLSVDKEFELGESRLTSANELLKAINYTSCYVDGNGFITARPYIAPGDRPIEQSYVDDALSILTDDAEEELDIFDTPNHFIRTVVNPEADEILKAEYINKNPASPLSTVQRKRVIVDYEELTDIANEQVLQDYVYRIAFERSQVYNKIRFTTASMPHHTYSDNLFLRHGGLGIEGVYAETHWTIHLNENNLMDHEARKLVYV